MQLRTLLSLVNVCAGAVALGLLLAFPKYDGPAFYLLLGWMFGSMILVYAPWGSRPVGGTRTPSTTALPSGGAKAVASSAPAPTPPSEIPFCIYCAAPLGPGASFCPACGHRNAHL
jgi:hypothetical protein